MNKREEILVYSRIVVGVVLMTLVTLVVLP